jgi:uncharacterized protein YndB with AHSA1/START domain
MIDKDARAFTMSIDLAATPDDVWRALTDADELVRWFPLQARVRPGKGGTMSWDWDGQFTWNSRIDVWEPGRRLVLVEDRPAVDVKGNPLPGPSQRIAMEFTLESHAGGTRLRLVHSGFGRGANWDDELDSIGAGWQYELRGLGNYLEHHQGRDRVTAAVNQFGSIPRHTLWKRLFSPAGFVVTSGRLEHDERCTIRSATGDQLEGIVMWHNPGRDVALLVDSLDGGLFRVSAWSVGEQTGVQVWMTTYSPAHAATVRAFGERVDPMVRALLAN